MNDATTPAPAGEIRLSAKGREELQRRLKAYATDEAIAFLDYGLETRLQAELIAEGGWTETAEPAPLPPLVLTNPIVATPGEPVTTAVGSTIEAAAERARKMLSPTGQRELSLRLVSGGRPLTPDEVAAVVDELIAAEVDQATALRERKEAFEAGRKAGHQEGYEAGLEDGHTRGYAEGLTDADKLAKNLTILAPGREPRVIEGLPWAVDRGAGAAEAPGLEAQPIEWSPLPEERGVQIWNTWRSGGVNRWHSHPSPLLRNSQDRIDGHACRVALLAWQLFGDRLPIEALLELLIYALGHDHGESLAAGGPGDMPGSTKHEDPELAHALDRLEGLARASLGLPPSISPELLPLLKLADMLDARLWALTHDRRQRKSPYWRTQRKRVRRAAMAQGVEDLVDNLLHAAAA